MHVRGKAVGKPVQDVTAIEPVTLSGVFAIAACITTHTGPVVVSVTLRTWKKSYPVITR